MVESESNPKMQSTGTPPVLFIIFNRPALTRRVFAAIREARPAQLFVAADGPRADRPGEAELCAEARSVVEGVDWPCQVKTLFREKNLGCKLGPSTAITWFFTQVDEGIILEDDCLPHPSFFPFCAELLERFRDDSRVFIVSGTNDLGNWKATEYSYFYTLGDTPGWATWKRAWQHFDLELTSWTDATAQQKMLDFGRRAPFLARDIARGCQAVLQKNLDAWDYQWIFDRIRHGGLGPVPAVNLVSNIGFGKDATHTKSSHPLYADRPVYAMQFPLRHNPEIHIDYEYYRQCHRALQGPVSSRAKRWLWIHYRKLRNLAHRLMCV